MDNEIKQIGDYKFESKAENYFSLELQINNKQNYTRQYPIGKYFADYYFYDYNLVLEIDGFNFHSTEKQKEYDKKRNEYMNNNGFTVIRITGSLAIKNPTGIINILRLFPKGKTFFLNSDDDIAYVQQLAVSIINPNYRKVW